MGRVKVKDKNPSQGRYDTLWEILYSSLGLKITRIHRERNVFTVLMNDEELDKLLELENKSIFNENQFELMIPPECTAKRTVAVRGVEEYVMKKRNDEIKRELEEQQAWLKVEDIIRIPNMDNFLKIRMQNTQMVNKAKSSGLLMYGNFINSYNINEEVFIKLNYCSKCYSYEHHKNDCNKGDIRWCANCADKNHTFRDCKSNKLKCLNCGGEHHTLAMRCPRRKEIIRNKSKNVRERLNTLRQTNTESYARKVVEGTQKISVNPTGGIPGMLNSFITEKKVTAIVSSIWYATVKANGNGKAFKAYAEKMFKLNGLEEVIFPDDDIEIDIDDVFEEARDSTMETNDVERSRGVKRKESGGEKRHESCSRKRSNKHKHQVQNEQNMNNHETEELEESSQHQRTAAVSSETIQANTVTVKLYKNKNYNYPSSMNHARILEYIRNGEIKWTHISKYRPETVMDHIKRGNIQLSARNLIAVDEEIFNRVINGITEKPHNGRL